MNRVDQAVSYPTWPLPRWDRMQAIAEAAERVGPDGGIVVHEALCSSWQDACDCQPSFVVVPSRPS